MEPNVDALSINYLYLNYANMLLLNVLFQFTTFLTTIISGAFDQY